jgi:hypothetical protein
VGGTIYAIDGSDDLVGQFQAATGLALPPAVARDCGEDYERMRRRMRWLWQHHRREWIDFYAARSARFWQKAVDLLHQAGRKAVINSCRARDPFETLYMNGYDYRRLAATGVDAIVVETVAAGLALDPRPECSGPHRHDDFLAQVLLIKACMPETKLVFLHSVHDVVEEWDAIHHAPTVLEREIHSLPNLFHIPRKGSLRRCADGFLACLGDGIRHEEWQWLQRRWDLAFGPLPRRLHGATLVWSDGAMDRQVDDFTATRTWPVHRLLYHLMTAGAPVQAVARIEALPRVRGPLLALNLHLFPEAERRQVLAYDNGPLVAIGRRLDGQPPAATEFADVYPPHELCCALWGRSVEVGTPVTKDGEESIPEDMRAIADPSGFWDRLYHRAVSKGFIAACAEVIAKAADAFIPVANREANTVLVSELAGGTLRVVVKSRAPAYTQPTVELPRPIRWAKVRSEFPMMPPRVDGAKLTVKVPPKGIVVVDVR